MYYPRTKYGNITYSLDGYFPKNTCTNSEDEIIALQYLKNLFYQLLLLIDRNLFFILHK